MTKFYESFTFIIFFLITVIISGTFFGKKVTNTYLALILLSMLIFNVGKFKSVLSSI